MYCRGNYRRNNINDNAEVMEEGRFAFDMINLSFRKFKISSILLSPVLHIPCGFGVRSCSRNSYVLLFSRALIMTFDCSGSVNLNMFCLIASRIVLAFCLMVCLKGQPKTFFLVVVLHLFGKE